MMSISLQAKAIEKASVKKGDDKFTKAAMFAKWLMSRGASTVTMEACAKWLASQNPDKDITERMVRQYIATGRIYLELHQGKTIWNVKGEGWRIANEKEKAIHLVRTARNTVKWAERTRRLYTITDLKLLPDAMVYVFKSNPKAQEAITDYNFKFKELFKFTPRITDGK